MSIFATIYACSVIKVTLDMYRFKSTPDWIDYTLIFTPIINTVVALR